MIPFFPFQSKPGKGNDSLPIPFSPLREKERKRNPQSKTECDSFLFPEGQGNESPPGSSGPPTTGKIREGHGNSKQGRPTFLATRPKGEMMTDGDFFGLELLGKTDATFSPLRDFAGDAPGSFYFARKLYASAGIPSRSGKAAGSDRMTHSRQLGKLAAKGVIVVTTHRTSKFPFAKLTDAAEERLRRKVGLSGMLEAFSAMGQLRFFTDAGGKKWVPEFVMAGFDEPRASKPGSDNAALLIAAENLLLPALVRGWVESGATKDRHAAYRLTDLGRAALDGPKPGPALKLKPSNDAFAIYTEAFKAHRAELLQSSPAGGRYREIGDGWLSGAVLDWPGTSRAGA